MSDMPPPSRTSALGAFLRLWLVIAFSYVLLKFAFNLLVLNAIDVRLYTLVEVAVLPLGQTIVVSLVARGFASTGAASNK